MFVCRVDKSFYRLIGINLCWFLGVLGFRGLFLKWPPRAALRSGSHCFFTIVYSLIVAWASWTCDAHNIKLSKSDTKDIYVTKELSEY